MFCLVKDLYVAYWQNSGCDSCKGKGLYFPTQIFLDFIFKFLEIYLSFLPSKNCCFFKADCKGKGAHIDTKIILANSY